MTSNLTQDTRIVSPYAKQIFLIYGAYRCLLSTLLLYLSWQSAAIHLASFLSDDLFKISAVGYLITSITALVIYHSIQRWRTYYTFITLIIDVLFLHLILIDAGGATTGFGSLIIIALAASAILIPDQRATFLAALSTVLTIYIEWLLSTTIQTYTPHFVESGVMGCGYFVTVLLATYLTSRMSLSELIVKEKSQTLHELETINKSIVESMRTGIIACDENFHALIINNAACEMLYGPAQHHQSSTAGTPIHQGLQLRLLRWLQDDSIRTEPFQAYQGGPNIQVNFTKIGEAMHENILIFIEDIARYSQKAQQLKLASLGRLTASIAHEIRNPLSAISYSTQLLDESTQLTPSDKKLTAIMIKHTARINSIIENILQLSRRDNQVSPLPIDLKHWLHDFIVSFKETQTHACDIQIDIRVKDTVINFDTGQLQQVLTNLLQNALRFSAKNNKGNYALIEVNAIADSNLPYLQVIDHGVGIEEAHAQSLFEPFFTTSSKGTGLGLYLSREMCEMNQARLEYISRKSGACFRITFAHPKRVVQ